jgi:hypothetical protein
MNASGPPCNPHRGARGTQGKLGNAWRWITLLLALVASARADLPPDDGILRLQSTRRSESVVVQPASGARITLTQLNPAIHAWYVLTLPRRGGVGLDTFHLENADPQDQRIALDLERPGQLILTRARSTTRCTLWPDDVLERARRSALPYAPLCDGSLYLLNAVKGNRSALEATTEFLRDHVWRGDQIIGFVRKQFYQDAYVERTSVASAPAAATAPPAAPRAVRLDRDVGTRALGVEGLGIALGQRGAGLVAGQWYAAAGLEGIYVSAVQPGMVEGSRALDAVEAGALSYLVAFDLAQYELGFALGTEHPRLSWSPRVRADVRDPRLPGPDGIDSAAPLVRTGMINPALQPRVAATFTGGFKREHGAFRYGALAAVNRGSHYGFIEDGVVFSTLVPGLATVYVLDDDEVEMKTWTSDDDRLLNRIRHARQNGVPLLERGAGGAAQPGALIDQWGAGNWSGSSDERLRTLRAGACLLEADGQRHLVYGYFSSATPRAMAQVFGAYGCRYAMHLDMNALEHTYLALYPRAGSRIGVEHLVPGMSVLDKSVGSALVPRFLGFPDDRDFFYLVRKGAR